jgi:hypothetical protein
MSVYGTELVIFTLLFALVTELGFYAARWNSSGTLDHLDGWRLGGRLLRAEGEVHQRTPIRCSPTPAWQRSARSRAPASSGSGTGSRRSMAPASSAGRYRGRNRPKKHRVVLGPFRSKPTERRVASRRESVASRHSSPHQEWQIVGTDPLAAGEARDRSFGGNLDLGPLLAEAERDASSGTIGSPDRRVSRSATDVLHSVRSLYRSPCMCMSEASCSVSRRGHIYVQSASGGVPSTSPRAVQLSLDSTVGPSLFSLRSRS